MEADVRIALAEGAQLAVDNSLMSLPEGRGRLAMSLRILSDDLGVGRSTSTGG